MGRVQVILIAVSEWVECASDNSYGSSVQVTLMAVSEWVECASDTDGS